MPNEYSTRWIDTFLSTQDPNQTAREIAFLMRQLPLPQFRRVLDVCCGAGRHSAALASAGYEVVGIDRDTSLVASARTACKPGEFHVMDMRDIGRGLNGTRFDAAICLWQSFGYFDPAGNDAALRDIASLLKPGGRFVLDIYHREFFERHQGTSTFERDGRRIVETKQVTDDGRLRVELDYGDGVHDAFDWELFTPDDLARRALPAAGLRVRLCCAKFDEAVPASADVPRMQAVFEK